MVNLFGHFSTITLILISAWLTISASTVVTSSNTNVGVPEMDNTISSKTIEEVLRRHTNNLMAIPGVVGTGQGLCDGQPCIKVFVIKETPEVKEKVPKVIEGYPVKIEETGAFRALPKNQN